MSNIQNSFDREGYLYVPQFLHVENCQQYVQEFKNLIEQGLTKKDTQCPLSHSIGHSITFDSCLEQLTPYVEKRVGKKLYPTYAYARWYAPGDELKIHRDRPSCEISATITLGFEGNQWPIYMGYDQNKQNCRKIDMQVGDAVIYKGCEMFHWREKYTEGQWQAQVFIHYVDANGPFKEFKYDKREKLAHHTTEDVTGNGYFLVKKNAFSHQSCQKIIQQFEKDESKFHEALLINDVSDKKIRDTKKVLTEVDYGIGATLVGIGLAANHHQWKFNITHSNQSEFLRYDKNGHFAKHIDTIMGNQDNETRKLTVIAILNNEFEGGRLYFEYGKEKVYPAQDSGDVIIFPSFLTHGVEPVTSGIRRSIVTWLVGPFFK
jgi:hypothetical protein